MRSEREREMERERVSTREMDFTAPSTYSINYASQGKVCVCAERRLNVDVDVNLKWSIYR